MNKFAMQDKGVRATTILIDRRSCFSAHRSHGQGVVVKEDVLVKTLASRITTLKEFIQTWRNVLKSRKGYFALIAAHAKLGIVGRRVNEFFSLPMKGMAKRALNVHLPKAVNLPSRIKRQTCSGST